MMDKATYVNPFDPPRTKNQISGTKNQISGTGVESSWHLVLALIYRFAPGKSFSKGYTILKSKSNHL